MIIRNKTKTDDSKISDSYQERLKSLELIIDQFEEVALKYGPASSEELKTRIDKIMRRFDREFKGILDKKFDQFWTRDASLKKSDLGDLKDAEVPKFLRNYKK